MRFSSTLLVVACTITSIFVGYSCGTSPELKTILHVDAGIELENIAVRSNGQLLLTALGSAALYQFNPIADTNASVIATFPGVNCVFGIAEISPDVFTVAVGNYSRSTSAIPGSFGVWAVNLREREPVVSKVADLPYARYLNGMTTIPSADGWKTNATVLLTDTILGKFYHVDPTTFQSATVLSSNATGAEPAAQQPGLNGIRYMAETGKLYYTNTIAGVYGYIHLSVDHSAGGGLPFIEATGPFEVISSSLRGDDFVVLPDGTAYISGNPVNTVFKVTSGGDVSVFLGGANATTTHGPTSAALGRTALDRDTLYITSSGIQPNTTVSEGGKLWAVSLSDTEFSSPGCPAE